MPIEIKTGTFSGTGHTFDGTLADALRGLAQNIAVKAASAVDDFTADNSGGTPGASISALADVTLSAVGSNNCIALTEANAAASDVADAIATILEQVDAVNDVVGAFSAITDNTGGSAGSGTIAAIDASGTGAGSSLVSAVAYNAHLKEVRARLGQTVDLVNKLANATGITPLTSSLGPDASVFGSTVAVIDVTLGTAVDGSDDTTANAAVLKTEWDDRQGLIADAVASMAAKLDEMTADANATAVCTVVAG